MTPSAPILSIDKLTLVRRYPAQMIPAIIDKATDVVDLHGWYRHPANKAGAAERLQMILPTLEGQPSKDVVDIQFKIEAKGASGPTGYLRLEWNPAKAGHHGNSYMLGQLAGMLLETVDGFLANASVTRLDLAVDVPGLCTTDVAVSRTSRHKLAEVFVGADGAVNSLRVGARGASGKSGSLIRVYDRDLPFHDAQPGLRAEVQLNRAGRLSSIAEAKNPFAGYRLYHFGVAARTGLDAALVALVREQGDARALKTLKPEPSCAARLEALLDSSRATWWDPEALWPVAKAQVSELFPAHTQATAAPPMAMAA